MPTHKRPQGKQTRKTFYWFHWGTGEEIILDKKKRGNNERKICMWFFSILGLVYPPGNHLNSQRYLGMYGWWGKQRLCKLHCTEEKSFVLHFWSLVFGTWDASCLWFAPAAVRNSKVSPDESLVAKVRTPNFWPVLRLLFAPRFKASKVYFLKIYFFLWNSLSHWNLPGSSKSEDSFYQYTALFI